VTDRPVPPHLCPWCGQLESLHGPGILDKHLQMLASDVAKAETVL
jgi:hypothetical protein